MHKLDNYLHHLHHLLYPHLPDRVSVFASLSCTLVDGLLPLFLQVVDSHAAIIEAHCHQVGYLLMDVEAHDATICGVDVLWEGRVLQGVEDQHSTPLFTEII